MKTGLHLAAIALLGALAAGCAPMQAAGGPRNPAMAEPLPPAAAAQGRMDALQKRNDAYLKSAQDAVKENAALQEKIKELEGQLARLRTENQTLRNGDRVPSYSPSTGSRSGVSSSTARGVEVDVNATFSDSVTDISVSPR